MPASATFTAVARRGEGVAKLVRVAWAACSSWPRPARRRRVCVGIRRQGEVHHDDDAQRVDRHDDRPRGAGAASTGCGTPPDVPTIAASRPGDVGRTITSAGEQRTYRLSVPRDMCRHDPPHSSSTCTVPAPTRSRRAPTATSPVPRRPAACSWSRRTRTPGSGNSARPGPTRRSSATSSTTSRPATASTSPACTSSACRWAPGRRRSPPAARAGATPRWRWWRSKSNRGAVRRSPSWRSTAPPTHRRLRRRRRERRCREHAEQGSARNTRPTSPTGHGEEGCDAKPVISTIGERRAAPPLRQVRRGRSGRALHHRRRRPHLARELDRPRRSQLHHPHDRRQQDRRSTGSPRTLAVVEARRSERADAASESPVRRAASHTIAGHGPRLLRHAAQR